MMRVDAAITIAHASPEAARSARSGPRSESACQNAGGTERRASARFSSSSANRARAGKDAGDGRMRARELQRGCVQRHVELGAERFDRGDARDELGRRRRVVEIRHRAVGRMRAGGENAGVERTADDDRAPRAARTPAAVRAARSGRAAYSGRRAAGRRGRRAQSASTQTRQSLTPSPKPPITPSARAAAPAPAPRRPAPRRSAARCASPCVSRSMSWM